MQLGIAQAGIGIPLQPEAHTRDDVAVGLVGVEEALPIAKTALRTAEFDEAVGFAVKRADLLDGLRDLLAVSADVLYRGSAHRAWDACEALDARHANRDGAIDERIPILAGGNVKLIILLADTAQGDVQNQTRKTAIAHQQIAASAQHKERHVMLARPADCCCYVLLCARHCEVTRRAADTEGGMWGEGDSFADVKSSHDVEGIRERQSPSAQRTRRCAEEVQ